MTKMTKTSTTKTTTMKITTMNTTTSTILFLLDFNDAFLIDFALIVVHRFGPIAKGREQLV